MHVVLCVHINILIYILLHEITGRKQGLQCGFQIDQYYLKKLINHY